MSNTKNLYQSYYEFARETMNHEDADQYALNMVREASTATESYAKTYAVLTKQDETDMNNWLDGLRGAGL